MKPFLSKIYVAFNGMPMQECTTHEDAKVLRNSIIEHQSELKDSDFSEDKLSIIKLNVYKLSNK